ncbi:hypothetical protein WA538_000188 [Blastocystis sp. DL]
MSRSPLVENRGSADPYYAIRDGIESTLSKISNKYEAWRRILETGDTARDEKFSTLNRTLPKDIDKLTRDVKGVEKTVILVEQNPSKYSHIDARELKARRLFINNTFNELKKMQDYMKSPRVLQKIEADQRKMLAARKATSSTMAARDYANNSMIKNNQAMQSEYMKKQDQSLSILADGVDRLDDMAKGIGDEINQQDALLTNLDTDVSEAQNRLEQARGKMQKLLKTNNKCELWTIIILFVAAVILVFSLF